MQANRKPRGDWAAGGRIGPLLPTLIVSCALIGLGPSATAQKASSGDAAQPRASARVSGRVIAADNGASVRRAQIVLSGRPAAVDERKGVARDLYVTRRVETDENGRFEVVDLPTGTYFLSIESATGFIRPALSTNVAVSDGKAVDVTIRLERAGAISGRILDQAGEGIVHAQAQAFRREPLTGRLLGAGMGSGATTDDLGQFRLFDLPAGDYYVVAAPTPQHHPDVVQRTGYAPTYYPGCLALRDARLVVVRAGQTSANVEFALASARLASVVVDVIDSDGDAVGSGTPMTLPALSASSEPYLTSGTRNATRREDGKFLFADVPPGDYYLVVHVGPHDEQGAYVIVTVNGDDLALTVQTNTGAKISGRIVIEGWSPRAGASTPPPVWVSANPPLGKFGPVYARVAPADVEGKDLFELTGLRGPMVLSAEVALGALVSIRRGAEEIAGKTLEFGGTEVIDDVVVVVTTEVADLHVRVAGTAEESEPVLVVLFSEDRSLRQRGRLQYARALASPAAARTDAPRETPQPTDSRGQIEMMRMVPGRYLVVAVPDSGWERPTDPQILEKLEAYAVPVTLTAGRPATIVLKVARIQ